MVVVNTNTRQHRTISLRWNDLCVNFPSPTRCYSEAVEKRLFCLSCYRSIAPQQKKVAMLATGQHLLQASTTEDTQHSTLCESTESHIAKQPTTARAPSAATTLPHSYFNPPYRVRHTVGQQPTSNPCDHQTSHSPPEHRNGRADTEQCLL